LRLGESFSGFFEPQRRLMTKIVLFSLLITVTAYSVAYSKVGYTTKNDHAIEITGLSTQCEPGAGIADFHGKVIKRDFEENQLILKGVVIEAEDGSSGRPRHGISKLDSARPADIITRRPIRSWNCTTLWSRRSDAKLR
jgi:hypothetical protein